MKTMKKVLMSFILSAAIIIGANAQAPLYVGGTQVNAGFGFSGWGLPVFVGLDYGIAENFTIGGEISFRVYDNTWSDAGWKHTIITMAGNGNYHFNSIMNIPSNWDFYAGLSIGYSVWNTKYEAEGNAPDYNGTGGSGLFLTGQVGGRYFFNDNIGINIEFGGGTVAGGKIGVTFVL